MKSFDSLLSSLRLKSMIQNRVVLGEPWGVKFPPQAKTCAFHYMENGGGIMTVAGEKVTLEQGDLVVVFNEHGHTVQDLNESPAIDLYKLLKIANVVCKSGLTVEFGGDGAQTSVISGDFCFDETATHPLFRVLPPYILLKGQEGGQSFEWLDTTLNLLSKESMEMRSGAMAVLDRLCDVLFIQALRGWMRSGEIAEGFPAAVREPAIDEALDLMQRQPAEPWTVESLARRVALSRSTFAEKFRRLAGDTPMEYLARWRMHTAARLLSDGQTSVAAIAEKVGYESEAAFAKAFKKRVGTAPGAYRRARGSSVEQLAAV